MNRIKKIWFIIIVIVCLAACCIGTSGDCEDVKVNFLSLAFDTSIITGYKVEDIDTIEIIFLTTDLKFKQSKILRLDPNSNKYFFEGFQTEFGLDINSHNTGKTTEHFNIITQNLDTFFIRNIGMERFLISDNRCSTCFAEKILIDIDGYHLEFLPDNNGHFEGSPILLIKK